MSIKYLSPSTFIKYRKNCEWRVYLEKVKYKEETEAMARESSMAAATGTIFDAIVKGMLNRRVKVEEEIEKRVPKEYRSARLVAEAMVEVYKKGPLEALKKEGIGYGNIDQETELQWDEPILPNITNVTFSQSPMGSLGTIKTPSNDGISVSSGTNPANVATQYKTWKSILYGQPDMTLKNSEVIDWKCQGMWGRGTTPRPGFSRCFVYKKGHQFDGRDLGPSPDDGLTMESINEDWAVQLYLYNRLLGHHPGTTLRAGIENICVDSSKGIWCASYRNVISVAFQLKIEKEFHVAFDVLSRSNKDKSLVEPASPTPYRCITYGKLCGVARYCEAFQRLQLSGVRWE